MMKQNPSGKNQLTVALQNYRLVGSVGDKTAVEIAAELPYGSWQTIGSGTAKRHKGDIRDRDLALQLACVRAFLDVAKRFALEGERNWPGYFQEWL